MKSLIQFTDPPEYYPLAQVDGTPLKPLTEVVLERRATTRFKSDPVPEKYLEAILRFGMQSPSGYNLQPWNFIVVRELAARRRLQSVAMDQAKVAEAPIVIVAFAIKGEWRSQLEPILREGVRRGVGEAEKVAEVEEQASKLLNAIPPAVWLNRQTMIAVTTMMLVAEAYGLDTAPMEGFDPAGVKKEFGLPEAAEVVALLAIGFAAEPRKAYPGRLSLDTSVHLDRYGNHWPTEIRKTSGEFPASYGLVPAIDVLSPAWG